MNPAIPGQPGAVIFGSPDPRDAYEGGLPEEGDYVVAKSRWIVSDYGGRKDSQTGQPIYAFGLQWTLNGVKGQYEQFYSGGDASKLAPCDEFGNTASEGTHYLPLDQAGQRGLNKSTNAMFLISSLVELGWPHQPVTVDARQFEGLSARFAHKPQPTRTGLSTGSNLSLIPHVIHQFPGVVGVAVPQAPPVAPPVTPVVPPQAPPVAQVPAAPVPPVAPQAPVPPAVPPQAVVPPVPPAPPQPPAAPVDGAASDFTADIQNVIQTVMESKNGQPFTMEDISGQVFTALGQSPNRDAVVNALFNTDITPILTGFGLVKDAAGNISKGS